MEKRELPKKPEIRMDEEAGKHYIEGYAIVFNRESKNLGDFVEVIEREAMNGTDVSDIMGRYNHSVLIGRSTNGTLRFSIDNTGVRYSIELPNAEPGGYLREMVERGDINGSSFAFDVAKNGDVWEERKDGTYKRTIKRISKLYDMGPVDNPAYADTTSAMRSLEKHKSEEISEAARAERIEREKTLRKLVIGDED